MTKRDYNKLLDKLLDSGDSFSEDEQEKLLCKLRQLEESAYKLEQEKLRLGRLVDLNKIKCAMNKDGADSAEIVGAIKSYFLEDSQYLAYVEDIFKRSIKSRDYFFGYPANMSEDTYLTQYLRMLESRLYLMNNCGDPDEKAANLMNTKDIERQIVDLFVKNIGLTCNDGHWGYVTSGGTESNYWGLREGILRYPDGKVYFSDDAHYSIEKFFSYTKDIYTKIPVSPDGSIDTKALFEALKLDTGRPAIILLTFGTTKSGAVDDIKQITGFLQKHNIPSYVHVDAALYGGIPKNQIGAPIFDGFRDSEKIDSVAISLHKYPGLPDVKGVLIAKNRGAKRQVDYIGQTDSTFLGSRSLPAFSALQRCRDVLNRSTSGEFLKNVEYLKMLLSSRNFPFYLNGNTFVVDKPSDEICKKYQLACFSESKNGKNAEKAHMIIFPYHKKEVLEELARDLTGEKQKI